MKALIAGAGISGLATGIALRQAGFHVEVFERSRELQEIGAGLMIWPNGSRSLEAIGVEIKSLDVQQIRLNTWRGRRLIEYPIEAISKRFGSTVAFVHRADLQAALALRFGIDGLHLGAEVSGFKEDLAKVEVILQDGTSATGDILVGADGLRSPVRRQLLGDGDPYYMGSTIWRGILNSDAIPLQLGAGVDWFGRGSEFLAFHLTGDRIYWAAVTKEPQGEKSGPGGHKTDLIQRFGNWVEPIPALIAATKDSAILRNDMYDRPPARSWSLGRVTLVGDAAHPMTPNLGQGACQALEDAVALRESFAGASSIADAFRLYEGRHLGRANRAVNMSRQSTRAVQVETRLLCALRDSAASLLPRRVLLRMLDATLAASA